MLCFQNSEGTQFKAWMLEYLDSNKRFAVKLLYAVIRSLETWMERKFYSILWEEKFLVTMKTNEYSQVRIVYLR